MQKFVIYYRVSTKSQGESGLGLEAQERDVKIYLDQYLSDSDHTVVDTITDVKSGKGLLVDRPLLAKAVSLAEEHNATLLVAKIDRLGRDLEVIAHLIKRVDVKVASMPNADNFQLHIYAALAQQERDFISQRTKAAAKSKRERAKVQGVKFQWGAGSDKYQKNESNPNKRSHNKAVKRVEHLREPIQMIIQLANKPTLQTIANELTKGGYLLPSGKAGEWKASQVQRVRERLGL